MDDQRPIPRGPGVVRYVLETPVNVAYGSFGYDQLQDSISRAEDRGERVIGVRRIDDWL